MKWAIGGSTLDLNLFKPILIYFHTGGPVIGLNRVDPPPPPLTEGEIGLVHLEDIFEGTFNILKTAT